MKQPVKAGFLQAPWDSMTLPGLARGAALLRPDAVLLSDAENKQAICGRAPQNLTAAVLDEQVNALALKLGALGLRPGDTVLVVLPNIVEAATAILAVLAGGGVPAVLPVFEPLTGWVEAANLTSAAGIVTIEHFAGLALAETARAAAAGAGSVRFIASFGERAPSGVAALDSWKTVEFLKSSPATPPARAHEPALVTFDRIGGEMRAFARTHQHLIAEAANMAAQAQVAVGSSLLMTLPPASTAGVVAGIALPLLAGAQTNLDALFDDCTFAARLGRGKGLTIVLPARAEQAFQAHCAARHVKMETLIFIHRLLPGDTPPATQHTSNAARRLDSVWLGEAAGWLGRRDRASDLASNMGFSVDLFAGDAAPLRLESQGATLVVTGAMAAQRLGADASDEATSTGFPASFADVLKLSPTITQKAATAA